MKRTRSINLQRMRKTGTKPVLKPLFIALSSVYLASCSQSQPGTIYKSVADCDRDHPEDTQACEAAYQQALADAQRTGPRYQSADDCEYEFGTDQCTQYYNQETGQSWFMPAMAGFLLVNALNHRGYRGMPLYTSHSYNSPFRNRWVSPSGKSYGSLSQKHVQVGAGAYKPKPSFTRTLSRGGFGSSISAKSNWGGHRSSGGWGG